MDEWQKKTAENIKQPSRCKGERRVPALKGDSEVDEKRRIMIVERRQEKDESLMNGMIWSLCPYDSVLLKCPKITLSVSAIILH